MRTDKNGRKYMEEVPLLRKEHQFHNSNNQTIFERHSKGDNCGKGWFYLAVWYVFPEKVKVGDEQTYSVFSLTNLKVESTGYHHVDLNQQTYWIQFSDPANAPLFVEYLTIKSMPLQLRAQSNRFGGTYYQGRYRKGKYTSWYQSAFVQIIVGVILIVVGAILCAIGFEPAGQFLIELGIGMIIAAGISYILAPLLASISNPLIRAIVQVVIIIVISLFSPWSSGMVVQEGVNQALVVGQAVLAGYQTYNQAKMEELADATRNDAEKQQKKMEKANDTLEQAMTAFAQTGNSEQKELSYQLIREAQDINTAENMVLCVDGFISQCLGEPMYMIDEFFDTSNLVKVETKLGFLGE
jgi:large-conductance mechanosensitive channel